MTKILVVDDSMSMRQMVQFTLEGHGKYDVTAAEDGVDALAKAKLQRFDAVVTDINMPNMTGIELCVELRKLPQYRTTPILMLTTESAGDMKAKGKAAGATGWLVKPFNPEKLIKTIQRVL